MDGVTKEMWTRAKATISNIASDSTPLYAIKKLLQNRDSFFSQKIFFAKFFKYEKYFRDVG